MVHVVACSWNTCMDVWVRETLTRRDTGVGGMGARAVIPEMATPTWGTLLKGVMNV